MSAAYVSESELHDCSQCYIPGDHREALALAALDLLGDAARDATRLLGKPAGESITAMRNEILARLGRFEYQRTSALDALASEDRKRAGGRNE